MEQVVGSERKKAQVKVRLKEVKDAKSVISKAMKCEDPRDLCVLVHRLPYDKLDYVVTRLMYIGHTVATLVLGPKGETEEKVVEAFYKQIRYLRPELKQWG